MLLTSAFFKNGDWKNVETIHFLNDFIDFFEKFNNQKYTKKERYRIVENRQAIFDTIKITDDSMRYLMYRDVHDKKSGCHGCRENRLCCTLLAKMDRMIDRGYCKDCHNPLWKNLAPCYMSLDSLCQRLWLTRFAKHISQGIARRKEDVAPQFGVDFGETLRLKKEKTELASEVFGGAFGEAFGVHWLVHIVSCSVVWLHGGHRQEIRDRVRHRCSWFSCLLPAGSSFLSERKMSERDSIFCATGCACSVEAAGLLGALPDSQGDLRKFFVTIVWGHERMKYYVHQEIAYVCWLYTALDNESLLIINNGPMEAESFIARSRELHMFFRKLAHVNDNHDIKASFRARRLPTDLSELRSFVKTFVEHVQHEARKEVLIREDHLDQLKVFKAYLEGENWASPSSR